MTMARKGAEAQHQQTALAAPEQHGAQGENALALLDDFDFGANDGLQEIDGSDLKLPVFVWNMKGKRADGSLHQLNEFYDTLSEKSFREVKCAFIHLHKTHLFARFDNSKNETEIVCSSNDRKTGLLRVVHDHQLVGTERQCDRCPDAQWTRDAQTGKNTKNCADVYGVFGVVLDANDMPTDGFLIRFKKTGLQPFKTHMQKHHLNRRALPNGKRAHVPLFAFGARLTLEVDKSGNFAIPVIETLGLLPKETITILAGQSKFFSEVGDEATKVAERQEAKHEGHVETSGETISGKDFQD